MFEKHQKEAKVSINVLMLDVETRWNSVCFMLQRVEEQKQAIRMAELDPELNIPTDMKVSKCQMTYLLLL